MKTISIAVASLMLTVQATHAQKPDNTPVKGPSAHGFSEYDYPNGLKVLLNADPSQANVSVTQSYRVGYETERAGESGIAHVVEHMTFRGTTRHPNIPRE